LRHTRPKAIAAREPVAHKIDEQLKLEAMRE
jgi:hypothetical protein